MVSKHREQLLLSTDGARRTADKKSLILIALKRILVVCFTFAASGLMAYFLCVYLPQRYLPQTHKLVGIKKVEDAGVELRPVEAKEVRAWGLSTKDAEIEDYEELEEEQEGNLIAKFFKNSQFKVQSVFLAANTYKDRHILIGDIHGQKKELQALLRKVKYNKKRDHLLVLGDFISKGPDSLGVVDELIDLGAKCIMGNHEYYVLQYYAKYHGLDDPHFVKDGKKRPHNAFADGYEQDPEFQLARKLQPQQVEFINNCPVMYSFGKVPVHSKKTIGSQKTGNGVAVHAGLRWDSTRDLNDQDPLECLQMRSYIGPHYNETTDDPSEEGAVSWSKIWNEKHEDSLRKDDYVVYYGHDARRGLKLKPWSKGLDAGCVKGDDLAAIVIWKEKTAKGPLYKEQVVKVPCGSC